MVIVDTSVWIDYLRGLNSPGAIWLDREITQQRIGLIGLILTEILQGIRYDRDFAITRDELLKLEIPASHGIDLAILAAANYRTLRALGYTVNTMDCWIATFCIKEGHGLLHNDRDFDAFEAELGLRVVHP